MYNPRTFLIAAASSGLLMGGCATNQEINQRFAEDARIATGPAISPLARGTVKLRDGTIGEGAFTMGQIEAVRSVCQKFGLRTNYDGDYAATMGFRVAAARIAAANPDTSLKPDELKQACLDSGWRYGM